MLDSTKLEKLNKLRHELNQNAELSGEENKTAKLIASFLRQCQPDRLIENISGHGVLAIWNGSEKGNDTLFRAELDALPIQETNDLAYNSSREGVSHKCGHDGHMTILCGLALQLASNKPSKGSIMLLFQPAEETGQGAKSVLADKQFQSLNFDYAFCIT